MILYSLSPGTVSTLSFLIFLATGWWDSTFSADCFLSCLTISTITIIIIRIHSISINIREVQKHSKGHLRRIIYEQLQRSVIKEVENYRVGRKFVQSGEGVLVDLAVLCVHLLVL